MIKLAQLLTKSPAQLRQTNRLNYGGKYNYNMIDKTLDRMSKPLYYYLIAANLGVFGLWQLPMVDKNFMISNFTKNPASSQRGMVWTYLTYSVSHYHFMHLLFNMIPLYFFGKSVEQYFGSKRLLSLYVVGALAGALFSSRNNSALMGASAAMNAILTYYICNFPRQTIILFVIPVPAWIVGVLIVLQSYFNSGTQSGPISYESHLGGCMAGIGYYFFTRGRI